MEDIDTIDQQFHEGNSSTSQQSSAEPTRLLSFRLEPGFRCFFQNWVQSHKVSIFECYDMVLKSHLHLERLRWPTKKLLARDDLSLSEKSLELFSRSTPSERFFIQGKNEGRFKNNYAQQKQERIKQLEMQVELYRRRREEALQAKREHFRKLSNQQQEVKRRALEEQQRRQQVLDELRREQSIDQNKK